MIQLEGPAQAGEVEGRVGSVSVCLSSRPFPHSTFSSWFLGVFDLHELSNARCYP